MASDSSSAVLDLNDADTEDTEPPSVTDDIRDGAPLIMEHGYDIAVRVDAPMKQLSTLETFVTYRVRCVCARWPTPPFVRRRYNHFKVFHKRLSLSHLWVAPPPLPPLHTARQQLDRYSAAIVSVRTRALHAFLDRVAKHPIFTHCEDFRLFLTTPDEDFDKVFKKENNALNLWGLSAAIYGSNESKPPANGARVKDPEWTSYAEYLTSLQQKLTTLCTLTTKLQKGTVALTTEMMNMKRTCDAWSSQAGGATGRAAAALAAGVAPRPPRYSHTHCAVLPLLAAYTGAHVDKIRQRDQLHAAYVSGTNATGEMHNKLEQCSEALRSELSDWLPKTRSEIKSLLLELADSQVSLHTQMYSNWEHALRLSQDANVEELFKTVSKTAVLNLSPSRCRSEATPTETERDLDDLENYSNDSDSMNESRSEHVNELNGKISSKSELVNELSGKISSKSEHVNELSEQISSKSEQENELSEKTEWIEVVTDSQLHADSNTQDVDNPLTVEGVLNAQEKEDFLSDILDDTEASGSREVKDSTSSKSDVVSDPLREFSDVDLS